MTTLNALSVDLEEYFQVSNFDRVIDRSRWAALPSRVDAATRRLLDLFEASGATATFFVLGWVAERHPDLVRAIAARGHEIACHGYGHELVYEIGEARFREDVRRAHRAIEDATGDRVAGYRAPSYSVTERSLWALDVLAEEGFTFDSSIFPIRHHRYGIPGFTSHPLRLRLPNGGSLLEFPLTTVRLGRWVLPLAGGAYLRFFPQALFRWGLSRNERAGHPNVLYLHPWEIDAGQPVQDVSLRVRVNHYYNLSRMESKLAGLLRRFRFRSLGEVLDHLDRRGEMPDAELSAALEGRIPPVARAGVPGAAEVREARAR